MGEGIIALFIPIISIIVIGVVLISYFYFRYKEKQVMLEKGLSLEQMVELLKSKKETYGLLKTGIIIFFFGIGIGIGILLEDATRNDNLIPLLLFTMLGLGFIAAYIIGRKLEQIDSKKNVDE